MNTITNRVKNFNIVSTANGIFTYINGEGEEGVNISMHVWTAARESWYATYILGTNSTFAPGPKKAV
jgi:hypothetical protein